MLGDMWSTLLMLLVVALAGWAVAFALRSSLRRRDPQAEWEHWLETSGLRPVLPRTRPVAELVTALDRRPAEVDRAAMGRAGDGALVVVTSLDDGTLLVAAQRSGPVPTGAATTLVEGWQVRLSSGPLEQAWAEASWLRNGPATVH